MSYCTSIRPHAYCVYCMVLCRTACPYVHMHIVCIVRYCVVLHVHTSTCILCVLYGTVSYCMSIHPHAYSARPYRSSPQVGARASSVTLTLKTNKCHIMLDNSCHTHRDETHFTHEVSTKTDINPFLTMGCFLKRSFNAAAACKSDGERSCLSPC